MVTITANDAVQSLLNGVKETAQIQDVKGNVLGYYTPLGESEATLYERARQLFDPVEMKRRKETEHQGYTIDQVMQHLKSLETSE